MTVAAPERPAGQHESETPGPPAPDQLTPLFRRCALVGLSATALALLCAVGYPRPGKLPERNWDPNMSEAWQPLLLGTIAVALVVVLVWRLRRSVAWPGDLPAAAVQIATLLPAVVWGNWLVWNGVHNLFAGHTSGPRLPAELIWRLAGVLWGLLAAFGLSLLLLAGFGLARLVAKGPLRGRLPQWSRISRCCILLLPAGWPTVSVLAHASPLWVLACVPTTALALGAVYAMQRYRRLPFRILLGGFGWGMFVAIGIAVCANFSYIFFAPEVLRLLELTRTGLSMNPAIFEEAGKGAGIVLLCLLARRWFDGLVSGLVIGASVGLGFNFVESVEYMANGAGYQHWLRQTVGIMGAHLAFSAILGAGIGAAYRMRTPRRGWVVVYAFLTAASGHFVANYGLSRLGRWLNASEHPYFGVLVANPLALLVLEGPFVVMYVMLLRRGLRDQAEELTAGARAEAWAGHGAITWNEVPVLVNPRQRLRAGLDAFRRGGYAAWRRTARLHAAQIELAVHRSTGASGRSDAAVAAERELRGQVLHLKGERAANPVPQPVPTGVTP